MLWCAVRHPWSAGAPPATPSTPIPSQPLNALVLCFLLGEYSMFSWELMCLASVPRVSHVRSFSWFSSHVSRTSTINPLDIRLDIQSWLFALFRRGSCLSLATWHSRQALQAPSSDKKHNHLS